MAGGLSSSSPSFSYDVFISFRGVDTRYGFTGNLYSTLISRGINTFIDDAELGKGEKILSSLLTAIEGSRIAIVVLSENYASSSFCLDELVHIMEYFPGQGRTVIPVFYKVPPFHVRRHSGTYGSALKAHDKRFKANPKEMQRLQNWKLALRNIADLSGYHFQEGDEYEYKFIGNIVEQVSRQIRRRPLPTVDHPVGLDSHVQAVTKLLDLGANDIRMLGIHGIGGVGKTTLAVAVYNAIVNSVEHLSFELCFMGGIRESAERQGLPHLQKLIHSELFGERREVTCVAHGVSILKPKLKGKKILLVLDDVDKHEQLEALAGESGWFGPGSRVIITTRDQKLLWCKNSIAYELETLDQENALELLCWKAFNTNQVDPSYRKILNEVVTYSSGLPLALEIIGSQLAGSIDLCKSLLEEYKKYAGEKIQAILKVSFDALPKFAKEIFLDIACCLKGYKMEDVKKILSAHHGISLEYSLQVLVEKSLLKVHDDCATLHDLVQDMGRDIVRLESEEEPSTRSRLWFAKDIIEVLQENQGSKKIQIIHLEFSRDGDIIQWNGDAFKKMEKLKTLIIKRGQFCRGPTHLPKSLKVLIWERYPSGQDLPCYFNPQNLVILRLPKNNFDSIQLAKFMKKEFVNMTELRFDECKGLTKISNMSCAPNLEKLSFSNCENLTEIDGSVGSLPKLKILNASYCRQLRSFPPLMLPSLKELKISGCSNLESFPEILGKMKSMSFISIHDIPKIQFPHSIHNLTELWYVELSKCENVVLPSSIIMLRELYHFIVHDCESLVLSNKDEGEEQVRAMRPFRRPSLTFRSSDDISEELLRAALSIFPFLYRLSLGGTFRILPKCIEEFHGLDKLWLIDCEELEEIRGIPPNIQELNLISCRYLSHVTRKMLLNKKLHEERQFKLFVLPGKRLPEWFEHRRRGSSFTFWVLNNKFLSTISVGVCVPNPPTTPNGIIGVKLTVNGKKVELPRSVMPNGLIMPKGHICILSKMHISVRDQVDEAFSENEWTCVVISAYAAPYSSREGEEHVDVNAEFGVHIIRERGGRIVDIQISDPAKEEEEADPLSQPLSLLFDYSDSHQIITTTPTLHLQEREHVTFGGVWCRCLCAMFSSLVSLCSSSSSLDSP